MLEYVPTAPLSLHTATVARAAAQAVAVAVDLQRPQRDLGAERRRLGVDAVGAPDHHRVAVRAGERRRPCASSCVDASISRSAASRIAQHQRGVDDVAATSARSGSTSRPAAPIAACTTSTNAATSWSVTASRSSTAATNASSTTGARLAAGGGVVGGHDAERRRGPRWPAARPRASGRSASRRDQTAAISGVRVARDHAAHAARCR